MRDAVGRHPALTFLQDESQTIGGFGRNDRFSYRQRFGGPGEVSNRVLVEAGTASGREPTVRVELRSYVSQFLQETGVTLGAGDEAPFSMRLLHFRRTFVEKMFDRISRIHFDRSYFYPAGMSFARSDALFPHAELAAAIRDEYETQCQQLCYGPYPSWTEVQWQFERLRHLL